MPKGMDLKSDPFASSLFDLELKGTLENYCKKNGIEYHPTNMVVSLADFTEYALDFQRRFVPDIDERQVISLNHGDNIFTLELDDGEIVCAARVVLATGISHFQSIPSELEHLPAQFVSHSSAHHDFDHLSGLNVTVIGGGASAVGIATLLSEVGAQTRLICRESRLRFSSLPKPGGRPLWKRLRHPSSGLGPGLRSWVCEQFPGLFRFLPDAPRRLVIRRHLGPSSAWYMRDRFFSGVETVLGEAVETAVIAGSQVELTTRDDNGNRRTLRTDHVIAATGYAVDVDRLNFLSRNLSQAIRTRAGMPLVSRNFEASIPGLYFVGPAAIYSFGPLMRFMVGAKYAAPLLARHFASKLPRRQAVVALSRS
jgi:thioredoxin reductase